MPQGLPTQQSSVSGLPPVVPPGIDRKKVLTSKLKIASHELEEERKVRQDLEGRTELVKKRLAELEAAAPKLRGNAAGFSSFVENTSIERGRRQDFLGEKGKLARSANNQSVNDSSSTAVAGADSNNQSQSHSQSRSVYEERQRVGASHDFPNLSTFFSYPPRDASGFLLPQKHRSSKRSAYCTTYSGEKILGQCEEVVNRRRMQRAEAVTREMEERDRQRKEELQRQEGLADAEQRALAKSARRPENTEAAPQLMSARERHQRFAAPGASRTAALNVHAMPPAGKRPKFEFKEGETLSSKRTLFYTDYTGKRIMIDAADMPRTHDFVVTGM